MINEFEELPKFKSIESYEVELKKSKRKLIKFYIMCIITLLLGICGMLLYIAEVKYIGNK